MIKISKKLFKFNKEERKALQEGNFYKKSTTKEFGQFDPTWWELVDESDWIYKKVQFHEMPVEVQELFAANKAMGDWQTSTPDSEAGSDGFTPTYPIRYPVVIPGEGNDQQWYYSMARFHVVKGVWLERDSKHELSPQDLQWRHTDLIRKGL